MKTASFLKVFPALLGLVLTLPGFLLEAQSGTVLKGSVQQNEGAAGDESASTYTDENSTQCSENNTSPYAGMNPLTCYGVMAPTDSSGQCSLSGMTVLKKVGSTCYYCQPIKPPINGVIIALDQINQASAQGFKCGVDQADPNCMAVCTRQTGSGPYIPPGEQPPSTTPTQNKRQPLSGRTASSDPCLPFGPGGYDYCANPTQPPGCICSRRNQRPPLQGRVQNTPCEIPGNDGVVPALAALESLTAQLANAERDTLVNVTRSMAPQYDMTRSGEGVRYMQGLLTNLGFRYLAAAVPSALRAIATGKPVLLPNPSSTWATRGGSQLPQVLAEEPAGRLTIPRFLLTTPRPLRMQEELGTCGLACVRMIVETIQRTSRPESYYVNAAANCGTQAYTPEQGSETSWLQKMLDKQGIPSTYAQGQSMKDLFNAVENGYPALVHTGSTTDGHFVVVDGFAQDSQKQWYVLGRDPTNLNLVGSESRSLLLQSGFQSMLLQSLQNFRTIWSGDVIYTHP